MCKTMPHRQAAAAAGPGDQYAASPAPLPAGLDCADVARRTIVHTNLLVLRGDLTLGTAAAGLAHLRDSLSHNGADEATLGALQAAIASLAAEA